MGLQAQQLADLLATTLPELGELKFTDVMSDYQNTIAFKRVVRKGKQTFDAGPYAQFDLIIDNNHSARFVGLGATDIVDIPDVMTQGQVPWRHVTWNWAIERREIAMNRTPRRIVDLAKTRRIAALGAAIELFEQRFWRAPVSGDDNPFGVPYWIVKSATAATSANADGFNGALPSGFTTVANISPTTLARWKNYTDAYTDISKEDLIRKMRRMAVFTNFAPLVDDIPTFNTGDDLGYYTNYNVIKTCEELLESQNEDLGSDVASMDGKTMFRRVPLTWVKELELDTTNAVYQINWGEFHTIGLRGEWLNETHIINQPGQHTVSATHTDCSFNWMVRNRRRQGVVSAGTTELS